MKLQLYNRCISIVCLFLMIHSDPPLSHIDDGASLHTCFHDLQSSANEEPPPLHPPSPRPSYPPVAVTLHHL